MSMSCQEFSCHSSLVHTIPGIPQVSDFLSSLLVLLAAGPKLNDGLFTNFSLEPSWRWYFTMTPFETIFLGIIILQFSVLNMFGIMPLKVDKLLEGDPSGRKKREAFELSRSKRQIASQLLMLLKKLDPDECSFKTVCELQSRKASFDSEIPKGITSMLTSLNLLTKKRTKRLKDYLKTQSDNSRESFPKYISELESTTSNPEEDVLQLYEEAAEIGNNPLPHLTNTTACEKRYHRCPVNSNDIIGYVKEMHMIDDLFFDI